METIIFFLKLFWTVKKYTNIWQWNRLQIWADYGNLSG